MEIFNCFGIDFLKKGKFPTYSSVGGRFTNGNYPVFANEKECPKGVFCIYDVPSYSDVENKDNLLFFKSKQYGGAYLNLKQFSSVDDFLKQSFRAKRRAEINKFVRKVSDLLNGVFFVIDKNSYNESFASSVLNNMFELIDKRFSEKKLFNRFMLTSHQSKIKEELKHKIPNGEASLAGIKIDDKIISVSLQYHYKDIMLYSIPTFDMALPKFNLGHVHIYHLLDYCFKNGFSKFDFSKGDSVYKSRWTNVDYDYFHYFIYSKNNIFFTLIAFFYKSKFDFIQFLRNKNFINHLKKTRYLFVKKKSDELKSLNFTDDNEYIAFENISKLSLIHQQSFFNTVYERNINLSDIKNISIKDKMVVFLLNESTGKTTI